MGYFNSISSKSRQGSNPLPTIPAAGNHVICTANALFESTTSPESEAPTITPKAKFSINPRSSALWR